MIKEKISVFIPGKLISEANNTDHWTKKRKRKLVLQFMVKAALLNRFEFPLPCVVTLERIGVKSLDTDNLVHCFKNIRDQIAEIIIESRNAQNASNLVPVGKKGSHDADPRIEWKYAQRTQKNESGEKHPVGFYVSIK